jgi:acyl-CoA thioester hydrolase, YbgC/YbaW family
MKEFTFAVRVYFSDTDAGGIVYHGRYLDFAEHARTEALREIYSLGQGEIIARYGFGFVVKSITADYQRPGYVDDLLTVKTSVKEFKRFSAVFSQMILRNEEVLAVVETKVGCIDMAAKRPHPIPDEIINGFSL